jgi:hypothetical protein
LDATKIIDWVKLPPKIMVGVFFGSGLFLFLPEKLMRLLYLYDFRNSSGFWFGLVFILSASILGGYAIWYAGGFVKKKALYRKKIKKLEGQLGEATLGERQAIADAFDHNNVVILSVQEGISGMLLQKQVIYQTSSISHHLDGTTAYFAYALQPWAVDYIKKHPDFVKVEYNHDDFEEPDWV